MLVGLCGLGQRSATTVQPGTTVVPTAGTSRPGPLVAPFVPQATPFAPFPVAPSPMLQTPPCLTPEDCSRFVRAGFASVQEVGAGVRSCCFFTGAGVVGCAPIDQNCARVSPTPGPGRFFPPVRPVGAGQVECLIPIGCGDDQTFSLVTVNCPGYPRDLGCCNREYARRQAYCPQSL